VPFVGNYNHNDSAPNLLYHRGQQNLTSF
jgi:hypothetical protein